MVGVLRLVLEVLGLLSCVAYVLSCVLYVWSLPVHHFPCHGIGLCHTSRVWSLAPPCLLSRVRARERRQETRGTRRKTGSIRHETQGTRPDICPRQKCHHCHVASRPFFSGGGEPAVQKSAVAGVPPGVPGNGPRIRAFSSGWLPLFPGGRARARNACSFN